MKGNNSLHLNQATMMIAVQYYLDNVLFREGSAPAVTRVGIGSASEGDFVILTVAKEEKAS